jgi:hypothetical protein
MTSEISWGEEAKEKGLRGLGLHLRGWMYPVLLE